RLGRSLDMRVQRNRRPGQYAHRKRRAQSFPHDDRIFVREQPVVRELERLRRRRVPGRSTRIAKADRYGGAVSRRELELPRRIDFYTEPRLNRLRRPPEPKI